MTTPDFYAVPDPDDPSLITRWHGDPDGRLRPWPPSTRYGPPRPRDVPSLPEDPDQAEAARAILWARVDDWQDRIRAAIRTDPARAARRFVEAAPTACRRCGRVLHSAASRAAGIGPQCRRRSIP